MPPPNMPPRRPPPSALQIDDAGRLQQDLPCVRCGYNLHGQFKRGQCPECETLVERSLSGSLLGVAAPWWVSDIAAGMLIIAVWVFVLMLFYVIENLIFGLITKNMVPGIHDAAIDIAFSKTQLLRVVPAAIGLIGIWRFTQPDPTLNNLQRRRQRVRLMARIGMSAALLLTTLGCVLGFYLRLVFQPSYYPLFQAMTIATATFGLIGLFEYARQLALRLPDHRLARQTRIVLVGVLVAWYLTAPAAITWYLLRSIGIRETWTVSRHWGISVLVAGFIFGIWSIVLAVRYRHRFNDAAIAAEKTWDADHKRVPAPNSTS